MMMKVEKQSSTFIKPFVPTPQTHCHYRLGFIDEAAPLINVAIALFFSSNSNHNNQKFVVQLEKSLEKTLTGLYPLAGRYDNETQTVECNDEGVEFIHAKVNIKLQEILSSEVDVKLIDEFIPLKNRAAHQFTDPLLSVQVTKFNCGGVALGLSAIHKIADASTLCTFLNEWAAMNREENGIELTGPGFNSSSLFPARGLHLVQLPSISDDMLSKYTRKKLTFCESQISNIRANAVFASGKNSTPQWSKVQLVMAILSKAFIYVDRKIHKYSRESIVIQPLNLREKMASLIPKHSCGNLLASCTTKCGILESTTELADVLSDSIRKAMNNYSKVCHDSEEGKSMIWDSILQMANIPESTNVIGISSWCKFPFYEANFGFGKPTWVAPGIEPTKNFATLMDDAQGNGVEAYVFLQVKDVQSFEEALDVNAFGA